MPVGLTLDWGSQKRPFTLWMGRQTGAGHTMAILQAEGKACTEAPKQEKHQGGYRLMRGRVYYGETWARSFKIS